MATTLNPTRRGFLTTVSAVGLNLAIEAIPALAQPASERPKEGDLLVSIESESTNALEPRDIPLGGPPLLAWPMDAAEKTVRRDSRLNKVLLLRLDPSTLVGATKDRAAEGVVAYSAICPHAGCEVNVWAAEQQTLEWSCAARPGRAAAQDRGRQAGGGETVHRPRRHCSELTPVLPGKDEEEMS